VVKEVKERFHFLDGLRGIASLMIVIHHAFTANIVKGINHLGIPYLGHYIACFTQSGVELFFVLSGVVLLRPYLRKQRQFRTVDYLLRRIKRIYPPYLVALLFAAGVCWYIHAYPTWYNTKVYHMVFYWPEIFWESFIINFSGQYYNLAWWSLGIEMLFYFLVPLILLVFPWRQKMSALRMTLLITVTMVVSVSLQLWLTRYHPEIYAYKQQINQPPLRLCIYQAICYPVCFLLGIILAARDFAARQAYVFIVPGLVLAGASIFYLPLVNPGYGLIYAGIIILSFNVPAFKRFLSKPIMIWLGERSYSLFLVHFSVFYLMDSVAARYTSSASIAYAVFSRGVGIPVAFLAAMTLFYFVERKQAKGLVTGNMFWPWQAGKISGLDQSNHVEQKSVSDNL
jgi:peptidoglycan/LPS O-acetylase OafA/YrhL